MRRLLSTAYLVVLVPFVHRAPSSSIKMSVRYRFDGYQYDVTRKTFFIPDLPRWLYPLLLPRHPRLPTTITTDDTDVVINTIDYIISAPLTLYHFLLLMPMFVLPSGACSRVFPLLTSIACCYRYLESTGFYYHEVGSIQHPFLSTRFRRICWNSTLLYPNVLTSSTQDRYHCPSDTLMRRHPSLGGIRTSQFTDTYDVPSDVRDIDARRFTSVTTCCRYTSFHRFHRCRQYSQQCRYNPASTATSRRCVAATWSYNGQIWT